MTETISTMRLLVVATGSPCCWLHAAAGAGPSDASAGRWPRRCKLLLSRACHRPRDYFRKAFSSRGQAVLVKDGALAQKNDREFAAGASGKAGPRRGQAVRKVELIDITATPGPKLELDYRRDAPTIFRCWNRCKWVVVTRSSTRSTNPRTVTR